MIEQPLIDQPEIGMQCWVVTRDEGSWWALANAKVEPGNGGGAQLAPTVQATKCNLDSVHGGRSVTYAALAHSAERLYSAEQSEQGSRFLRKRNTNRVVRVARRFEPESRAFRWVPLGELVAMLVSALVFSG